MDKISLLPDDLVLKILSLVPTKDAVTSSLLSKRWRPLWKLVPKLDFSDPDPLRASRFVNKFFQLHKAAVLETLHLTVSRDCPPIDIETWISVAISRGVRDLEVIREFIQCSSLIQLPQSLYTCETLVALTLTQASIVDVPLKICLRSLKTLFLGLVNFSCDENVPRLLSGCPVLEQLTVARKGNDNVKTFTIMVPSLLKLTVVVVGLASQVQGDDAGGFVIKAPSLQSLKIFDWRNSCFSLAKMPKLVKASIGLRYGDATNFMECLTSAKHLVLCVKPPIDSYPTCLFYNLVSLNLCACSLDWCCLILRHTPILRVLRFERQVSCFPCLKICFRSLEDAHDQWEQPSCVPQCLISSLETVEWTDYKGTEAQQKVVIYLLENTRQLKKMSIRSLTSMTLEEKHLMLLELAFAQRSSSKCRLLFA